MKEACIVCVKVCHSGHDVVYDGYTKTYCDCGVERSCKALTQRASSPNPNNFKQDVTSSSPLLPGQGKNYIF